MPWIIIGVDRPISAVEAQPGDVLWNNFEHHNEHTVAEQPPDIGTQYLGGWGWWGVSEHRGTKYIGSLVETEGIFPDCEQTWIARQIGDADKVRFWRIFLGWRD